MNTHVRDNLVFLAGDRISHKSYAVTLADADNTASETTIFSATVGDAIADGEMLSIECIMTILHNNGSVAMGLDIRYGGVETDLWDLTPNGDAGTNYHFLHIVMGRNGSHAYAAIADWGQQAGELGVSHGAEVTNPNFSAGVAFNLKWTWGSANANQVVSPKYGRIRYLGSAT